MPDVALVGRRRWLEPRRKICAAKSCLLLTLVGNQGEIL
jgi:hypothetical protein